MLCTFWGGDLNCYDFFNAMGNVFLRKWVFEDLYVLRKCVLKENDQYIINMLCEFLWGYLRMHFGSDF